MDITSTASPLQAWAQSLYELHGTLTPRLVLEAARSPESPAHTFVFNVDGEEAAEQFYLDRAHRLIRSIRVTIVSHPSAEPRRVRFFTALPGGEESAYIYEPLDELVRHPDKLQLARSEAIRRVADCERAVEDLDAIASDGRTVLALKSVRSAKKALITK